MRAPGSLAGTVASPRESVAPLHGAPHPPTAAIEIPSPEALSAATAALTAAGATIVDPVELAGVGKFGDAESEVLHFEFKDGLN